jgi:feruloyl esterase
LIGNPLRCDFDQQSLKCPQHEDKPSFNNSCLTPQQFKTLNAIYGGPSDPTTNQSIYPGFSLGSEREWMLQETSLYINYTTPILQNLVFRNLSYDVDTFDFGQDVARVNNVASPLIDEIGIDLSAYQKHRGKMIVTQGECMPCADSTISQLTITRLERSLQRGDLAHRAPQPASAGECFRIRV